MRIFPIILKPCPWQGVDWLASIQVRPKDGKPLVLLNRHRADEILANIALEIRALLSGSKAAAPPSPPQPTKPVQPTAVPPPVTPLVIPSASEESPLTPATLESPGVIAPSPAEKPPANRGTLHAVQRDMEATTSTPPDQVTITTPIHLELVRVPAGEFLMGSDPTKDPNARPEEQPQHRVYVSEFYIGKYPITNEQYAVFVNATKHPAPSHWKKGKIPVGKESHPVVYIYRLRNDTIAFFEWLSRESDYTFRLPTEAEWEKAARGIDGRIYPWGNEWDPTRLNEKRPRDTTPVGKYSPNGDSPYGVADMLGNVWELCADSYYAKEYQHRANNVTKDPPGPKQGDYYVVRGGAFDNKELWVLRCAARPGYLGYLVRGDSGLRVVMVSPFPSEALKH
jgi:formylglycine-generating enzyme required for sulfatase activity